MILTLMNTNAENVGKLMTLHHPTQLSKFCSIKCSKNNPETIAKMQKTIAKDPNYYQKRHEKIRKTNLKRYGVDIPAKSEVVKQHMRDTWKKNENIWQKRQERLKNTLLEKYGVENSYQIKDIADKSRHTHRKNSFKFFERFKDLVIPLFTEEEYLDADRNNLKWKCLKCGEEFEQGFREKSRVSNEAYCMPRCPKCYPLHMSVFQKEVTDFCKEHFEKVLVNDRKTIKPYELDIVIPSKKIAIECNGIYWHSIRFHLYKFGSLDGYHGRHLEKSVKCEEAGYRLIQIWEDDWNEDCEGIKERLLHIFNGTEEFNLSLDRVILNREWFNRRISPPGFKLIEETPSKMMKKGKEQVEDSGGLIYERV